MFLTRHFVKQPLFKYNSFIKLKIETLSIKIWTHRLSSQASVNNAVRYDVVIFGATGYTGKNTIKYVDRLTKEKGRNYTWAIAGRSEDKLKAVLKEMGDKIGKDFTQTPLIIADVKDIPSLENMAKQARVIVNTCGPYQFFGEPVVKACVENGCHHVDVSGESLYMEEMQYKYHHKAGEKGVYVVSACGFDSVPCDLGLIYLQSQFEGTLNSVDTYFTSSQVGKKIGGASLNTGTWESAIHATAFMAKLKYLRQKLYATKLPKFTPRLKKRGAVHTAPHNKKYALKFPGPDRDVVLRTQRFLYEEEQMRPVQIGSYFTVPNFVAVMGMGMAGAMFLLITKFECGRNLLLKHPKFFSAGFFSRDGPSEAKLAQTKFEYTHVGEGWSTKMADPNAEFPTKPDKKMVTQVSGMNPGYGFTCASLTICALTILDDTSKLPKRGGVYSPGAAFYHTKIIEEMQRNGVTFEVISKTP